MAIQRERSVDLMDLLDRILDKGIVLDAAERTGAIELRNSRPVVTSSESVKPED